jgi:pimeloyl-ACP methyl ester carboxylesterase
VNGATLRRGGDVRCELFPAMRTLDEVKAECIARVDRNAYPLAGLVPAEAREALDRLSTLDRDQWANAWSLIGDRYMERGRALPARSAEARETFMTAWRYYSFARWPVPLSLGKERAYDKALAAFLAAAESLDPPLEIVRIPFEGSEIVGYMRLPAQRTQPVPIVVAIGGLDSRKEDMIERFSALLPHGIGAIGFDQPGTGEAPVPLAPGSERMFSRVIDVLGERPEINARRIAVYGGSFGAHWAAKLAVTERERLCAVVAQSPPVHEAFQPGFLERAFVTREYLFDRGPALASMYVGIRTPEELLNAAPRNSLVEQGWLDQPTVEPMLVIGGVHDTQVPIADIDRLLKTGNAKTAWINPNGGHMGRDARRWPDPAIFKAITAPWLLRALEAD